MGLFDNFIYTDLYRLDLAWLIKTIKDNRGDIEKILSMISGDELKAIVSEKLEEWKEDGTLEELVSGALDEMQEEIDRVTALTRTTEFKATRALGSQIRLIVEKGENTAEKWIYAGAMSGSRQRVWYNPVTKRLRLAFTIWTTEAIPANDIILYWKWTDGRAMETNAQLTGLRRYFSMRIYTTPPITVDAPDAPASGPSTVQEWFAGITIGAGQSAHGGAGLFAPYLLPANRFVSIDVDVDARGFGGDYDDLTPSQIASLYSRVCNYWSEHEGQFDYNNGDGREDPVTSGHTDCSGMTYASYYQTIHWNITNLEDGQASTGAQVCHLNPSDRMPVEIMQPGDCVVFHNAGSATYGHVAMYMGNNELWDMRAWSGVPGTYPYGPEHPTWFTGPHPYTTDAENEWFTKCPPEINQHHPGEYDYAKVVRWIM